MATARRQASRANLVDVTWLRKKWGKPLKVTRVNGVASKLAAVSAELDALPSKFDKFLFPPAGTYLCRPIAGTTRVGAHGHGIAIDIAAKPAHYWLWSAHRTSEPIAYRNPIPYEIVEIFERQGFIWGGTWYHYDTCTSSTALNSWPLRPNPYLSVAYHFSPPLRLTAELVPQPLDAIPARDFPTSGTTPNRRQQHERARLRLSSGIGPAMVSTNSLCSSIGMSSRACRATLRSRSRARRFDTSVSATDPSSAGKRLGDDVRCFFGNHDGGGVDVGRGDRRHHRSVDHA